MGGRVIFILLMVELKPMLVCADILVSVIFRETCPFVSALCSNNHPPVAVDNIQLTSLKILPDCRLVCVWALCRRQYVELCV